MRLLLLVLIVLVALIQYPLWLGRGGWFAVWDLQRQVGAQRSINDGLRARNQALHAEVEDLRTGTEASEERARAELGMMRQGEVFVQILPPDVAPPEVKPPRNSKPATQPQQRPPAR
jgi:cell division protein FtsB